MQVFCDLENKEMSVTQDNIVVILQLFFKISTCVFAKKKKRKLKSDVKPIQIF